MPAAQFHGLPKMILDGTRRKLLLLRDLAVRAPLNIIEQENLASLFGETVDRLTQNALLLLVAQDFLGRREGAGDRVINRSGFQPLTPHESAQMIARQISRDRERKATRILDILFGPQTGKAKERFLGQVCGGIGIVAAPAQITIDLPRVPLKKALEVRDHENPGLSRVSPAQM